MVAECKKFTTILFSFSISLSFTFSRLLLIFGFIRDFLNTICSAKVSFGPEIHNQGWYGEFRSPDTTIYAEWISFVSQGSDGKLHFKISGRTRQNKF